VYYTSFPYIHIYLDSGLDMAGCYNGFVYHTKFDRYKVISRGALQNTGDNVLSLVRSISNAEEMYDTEVGNCYYLITLNM